MRICKVQIPGEVHDLKTRRRYCFLLPDMHRPVGGLAVLYGMADMLRQAGYDVALIHGRSRHLYSFAETQCDTFHLKALLPLEASRTRLPLRQYISTRFKEWQSNPSTPAFVPQANDVFVVPEFAYPEYAELFPQMPFVLITQDAGSFLRAFVRDVKKKHKDTVSVFSTSDVAAETVHELLGRHSIRLTLPVVRPELRADHPKKLQCAYMPRKLQSQSKRIVAALKDHPVMADVPIIAIENMTNAERDQVLNDSLIFLAFSDMEGFGLPPAEAMAAGSIVVGYTGVGAREYFSDDVGFVVEHGDMTGFIAQVKEVVGQYRADPAPLDALRARAARTIRARYTKERAQRDLLAGWAQMEAKLPPLQNS